MKRKWKRLRLLYSVRRFLDEGFDMIKHNSDAIEEIGGEVRTIRDNHLPHIEAELGEVNTKMGAMDGKLDKIAEAVRGKEGRQ